VTGFYLFSFFYKKVKRLSATTRVVRGPSGIGGQWLGVINYETRKTSTYVSGCGAYTPFGVGCNEKRVEARFFRKLRGSLIENPIRMKHPKERGLLRCPFPSLSLFRAPPPPPSSHIFLNIMYTDSTSVYTLVYNIFESRGRVGDNKKGKESGEGEKQDIFFASEATPPPHPPLTPPNLGRGKEKLGGCFAGGGERLRLSRFLSVPY